MRVLWTPGRIKQLVSDEQADTMNHYALDMKSKDEAAAVTYDGWELIEYKYIPAESMTSIWHKGSLTIRIFGDQDGTVVKQVFRKSEMVEIITYVEAKDL